MGVDVSLFLLELTLPVFTKLLGCGLMLERVVRLMIAHCRSLKLTMHRWFAICHEPPFHCGELISEGRRYLVSMVTFNEATLLISQKLGYRLWANMAFVLEGATRALLRGASNPHPYKRVQEVVVWSKQGERTNVSVVRGQRSDHG